MMDVLDALRKNALFDEFTADECEALAQSMWPRKYDAGHVFTREGESTDAFHVLLDGEIEVSRRDPVTLTRQLGKRMLPGGIFGLVALVDPGPRTATCQAATPVTVATLPGVVYKALGATNAPLAHRFQFAIARQLARDVRSLHDALVAAVDAVGKGDAPPADVAY